MFFIKDFVEKKKKENEFGLFIYERLPKPDSSKYT